MKPTSSIADFVEISGHRPFAAAELVIPEKEVLVKTISGSQASFKKGAGEHDPMRKD